jgi:imidazolonepropionase-like amidohydrolase
MLTLEPARILGIAANKGSLEAGKDADLVIWTGDPLRPDSEPRLVIIEGRVVSDKSSGKGG